MENDRRHPVSIYGLNAHVHQSTFTEEDKHTPYTNEKRTKVNRCLIFNSFHSVGLTVIYEHSCGGV